MTSCRVCNEPFDRDTIATCCDYLGLFHANEGDGLNCSGATSTEIRVIKLKRKNVTLYRCKDCTGTGVDSPTMLDAIQDLQTSIADLKSVITSLNVLKEEIP